VEFPFRKEGAIGGSTEGLTHDGLINVGQMVDVPDVWVRPMRRTDCPHLNRQSKNCLAAP
jgi:hypothetical protein